VACLAALLLPTVVPALVPALVPAQTVEATAGERLLRLVSRADYKTLAAATCSDTGLAFVPYTRNLSALHSTRLSRAALARFSTSRQAIDWGREDGSGLPIRLRPMAYHRQFVYDLDYLHRATPLRLSAAQVLADVELRALAAAFPQAEAVVYRFAGTPALGHKDRRELILVGRPQAGGWCLEALAHDQDTV